MVVLRDPGSVPENWRPVRDEENFEGDGSYLPHDASGSASTWPSSNGLEGRPPSGFCIRCQNGKPPRCHHCSICECFALGHLDLQHWLPFFPFSFFFPSFWD